MKIEVLKRESLPRTGVLGRCRSEFAVLLFLGVSIAASITACTTIDMLTYEDGNVYAELETNNPKQVTLTVDNHSGGDLILDQGRAVYIGAGRRSPLQVLGEGREASPVPLPPGARQSLSFAPAEALSQTGAGEKIADWAPEDNADDRFEFAYRAAGEDHPLVFPDDRERPILGKVKVSLDIPLPFSSSVIERRRKIYDQALRQAKESLGEDRKLRLVNIRYASTSNGFKEKALLSADVIAAD